MTNVLHVSSGNLFGGVEQTLATLAGDPSCVPELKRHFALCFSGRLSESLRAMGAPFTSLGEVRVRYPWTVWRARARLASLLRRERSDAVVCHMPWSYAIFGPVARRAGVPLVLWLHDAANGRHWIERWAARCKPDLVVCNSRFTASTMSKLFPSRPLPPHVVIHPPVPAAALTLDAAERAALRAELDTPSDATVLIQVGRMEPYKGHIAHLDALARLADVPGWVCWIVGGVQRPREQEYAAKLRERAVQQGIEGRVRFLGERRDVRHLLATADIFCQPNVRGEPYGIVFIEALQASLPVVATTIGGVLEIVDDSCGRLVPPSDPEALAITLRELVLDTSLRRRLGAAGPARAESLSSPEAILIQLAAALQPLRQTRT